MPKYVFTGTKEQIANIEMASFKCNSVSEFVSVMDISWGSHTKYLKTSTEYCKAYNDGTNRRTKELLEHMDDIIESISDKSAGAKLDAIKYRLNHTERRYTGVLSAQGIDLEVGNIDERLEKVYSCYTSGLLSEDMVKQLTTMLKTKHDMKCKDELEAVMKKLEEMELKL
jgi:hypothetical protein